MNVSLSFNKPALGFIDLFRLLLHLLLALIFVIPFIVSLGLVSFSSFLRYKVRLFEMFIPINSENQPLQHPMGFDVLCFHLFLSIFYFAFDFFDPLVFHEYVI